MLTLLYPHHPAFTTPLSALKGAGPKTLSRLTAEGFYVTGDLLSHTPKFYQDRRQAKTLAEVAPDEEALIAGTVISARAKFSPRTRRRYQEAQVCDQNGDRLTLTWFNLPPYYLKSLTKGRPIRVFGQAKISERGWSMVHPDIELGDEENSDAPEQSPEIRPVYAPIGELSSGLVKKLMDQAMTLLQGCESLFPGHWLEKNKLSDPIASLRTLHSPPGEAKGRLPRPQETRAFQNLALFELLLWRLMMLATRAGLPASPRTGMKNGPQGVENFWRTLPFEPSPEQKRIAAELMADLSKARPMSRLLQGEVGGGKTAVAGAMLFFALADGGQAALMAPTETLARQHYDFLKKSAEALGFECALLTGSLSEKEKKAVRAQVAEGSAQLVIGSQALLSPATTFKNLSLAVIDEQHRFGVRQRLSLRRKNDRVDILAMSATPIPRSLALMLYGDLDSSVLRGLLPGRTPAKTKLFAPEEFLQAYNSFLQLIGMGQGFVVSPRIGDSTIATEGDEEPPRSLDDIFQDIQKLAGPKLPAICLHGQMEAAEREKAMEAFRHGEYKILVATSIIEVGIDIPQANAILIEGAERFGLAQLHQLRGRVGRAGQKAHCLLLPSKSTPAIQTRLMALTNETDGQSLAELDLKLRGPGEHLGLKQSGWPTMTYAKLPQDIPLLAQAHRLAEALWPDLREEAWQDFMKKLNFEILNERLMVTAEEAT